jgi:ubiquinone/menaquinone biosynthesis C-methylase UbiE
MNAWGTRDWFSEQLELGGTNKASSYFAHELNGYERFRHAQLLKLLKSSGKLSDCQNLLDIGCASGRVLSLIQKNFPSIKLFGMDFLDEIVERARAQYLDIEFRCAALPIVPFSDQQFDCVIASEVLYYISDAERLASLDEISRVLTPNGLLIVSSVLGGQYLNEKLLVQELQKNFDILERKFLYNSFFHTIMKPIYYIHQLHNTVTAYREGRLELSDRGRRYADNWLFRASLSLADRIAQSISKLQWLPSLLNWLFSKLRLRIAKSNILVLARKKA